ncbi:MAG: hypothetical protein OXC41_03495 [Gammaproteobacteria bacterium]|nr:hypothetical protein [Gammaproteobacteria bacterium]
MEQNNSKDEDPSSDKQEAFRLMLHQLALTFHNCEDHTGMDFAPMVLDQLEKKVKFVVDDPNHLGHSPQTVQYLQQMTAALRMNYECPELTFLTLHPPDVLDS